MCFSQFDCLQVVNVWHCHIQIMSCLLKNRLVECLAAKKVKKSQLAFWLKMSRAYVTRLVRGDIQPSFEVALRIARYFGKPVEAIFQLDEIAKNDSVALEVKSACPARGLKASPIEVSPKSNFPFASATSGNQLTTPKLER